MPITDIVIVSVIFCAFVVFAVALAWGDYQTREIARASRQRALTGAGVAALKQNAGIAGVGRSTGERSKASAEA
jgi:hypothetical protein